MDWLEYHEDPVTLHSGQQSQWLVRGDLIFNDPHLRKVVLDYWQHLVGNEEPRPYWFLGVPEGGTRWAKEIAERVGGFVVKPVLPLPKLSKRGTLYIVDDVVTTGSSLTEWRVNVEQVGIRNFAGLAVVNRMFSGQVGLWAWLHMPLPTV